MLCFVRDIVVLEEAVHLSVMKTSGVQAGFSCSRSCNVQPGAVHTPQAPPPPPPPRKENCSVRLAQKAYAADNGTVMVAHPIWNVELFSQNSVSIAVFFERRQQRPAAVTQHTMSDVLMLMSDVL